MAEWLLSTFPTAVLSVLVLGGLTLAASLGLVVFRRKAPGVIAAADDSVAGVIISILAGIYGIVIAFVIVVLWEDFRSAQQVTSSEANSLSQLVQDSQAFPPLQRDAMVGAVDNYAHAVVNDEWDTMTSGDESPLAASSLAAMYEELQEVDASDPNLSTFYQEASSNLHEVDSNRRERIRLSQRGLPGVLQFLIVGGALLIIVFTFFFGIQSTTIHVVMTAGVTLLLGFSVLLSLLLQSPFSGDIAVQSSVFREGVLAQFWR
jgi:hypothetical protein